MFGAGVEWQRLANAVLHAATGVALFGFLARLFAAVLEVPRTRWLAFFGALWFVLHPVAVYGAGYLMQRSIVLATLFSVLALWAALEGLLRREAPWRYSVLWYGAAALAYLLALSSKEHAVMVPAVAAALALLVRGRSVHIGRRALAHLAVWLGLCAVLAAAAIVRRWEFVGAIYEPFARPFLERLGVDPAAALALSVENQAALFFRYLATWLLPWPGWISVDVRTAFPTGLVGWPQTAGLAAWLAYPVLAGWLLLRGGRAGLAGFALLYPWLLALTEFATVRVQEPFVLYRSYLWMSGLPALLPAALGPLSTRWRLAAATAACLVLAVLAHQRLETFSSALALWDDAARKNTDPRAPYVERAVYSRGLARLDAGDIEGARTDFERAVELNPASPDAYLTRGTWRLRMRRFTEALADFDRALALDPAYASAYNQRCVARAEFRRYDEAILDCQKAVALNPADDIAWINTGAVYRTLGRPADAAASYERALALKPKSASAHYNYGVLLLESGRRDTAVLSHFVIGCQGGVAEACDIVKRSRVQPR